MGEPSTASHLVDPYSIPLEEIEVAKPTLFKHDAIWPYFERLRAEDPVHYSVHDDFGPYWSVTRYDDIMHVDMSHEIFSSQPSITLRDPDEDFQLPMFIAMDRPKHDQQRGVVQGVVSVDNLRNFEGTIRERTAGVLDGLPTGETLDWVDNVSIELTTRMLATLFDFPFEDRRLLTRWSDVATAIPGLGVIETEDQRRAELSECLAYFTELWNQRVNAEPGPDLVSMLAHGEATRNMDPQEYLGNLVLLIVGGNDTTRNSMSGGVLALNQFPDQYQKLRDNQELIPNAVSEIIRWQTPLAHMRRTAKVDTKVGGRQIRAGDKVVMWYVSGNRDESIFPDGDKLIVDRDNVRRQISFGFGIHRCMGSRLAELQLRILWEEILKRFHTVEVVGEVERVPSTFVKGYTRLPVRLHPK